MKKLFVFCILFSIGFSVKAIPVILDFSLAPLGPIPGSIVFSDGIGGMFTITETGGTDLQIVDNAGDREIDSLSTNASFTITHSGGMFTPGSLATVNGRNLLGDFDGIQFSTGAGSENFQIPANTDPKAPIVLVSGPDTIMGVPTLSLTLSGLSDFASIEGRLDDIPLDVVPEPSTYALLSLLGLGFLLYRRRTTA